MASRTEAREHETRRKPYHKKHGFTVSFCFLFLHFKVLLRSVLPYFVPGWQIESLKIAASGAKNCAFLAMTNLVGFAGKRSNFRNETFERRCEATPRKKRPHKTKNVCFPNKNAPISCHCEAAERPWQSLSQRYDIPHRSTGARNKKKALSQKTWIHCFILLPLSSFQGSVSFRSTIVRFGMANRIVKDCRVGRKKLRPPRNDTKPVGFAKKPTGFLIGMF